MAKLVDFRYLDLPTIIALGRFGCCRFGSLERGLRLGQSVFERSRHAHRPRHCRPIGLVDLVEPVRVAAGNVRLIGEEKRLFS